MPIPTKDELEELRVSALAKEPATEEKKEEKVEGADDNKSEAVITAEVKEFVPLDKVADDEFLKEVERRGMKVSKETLTDEQKKKAEAIEEAEKYKFAIEQNLITAEGYQEAKSILASEGADLTKKEFAKAYREENKGATKEDIDSAYDDYYFVQKNIKVIDKQLKKNEDTDENELEVVETEKPKWDERITKLGEFRRNREAENIKNNAKSILDNIDSSYANYKTVVSRATDYSKNIEKVISETDFSAYPTTHKIKNKEISAKVKFEKPDEVRADVKEYLSNKIAPLFLREEKHNDIAEIKRQADKYIRDKYATNFEETLWDLAESSGINKAKVGSSAPLERELISDDSRVDELAKDVEKRLPPMPPKTETNKR